MQWLTGNKYRAKFLCSVSAAEWNVFEPNADSFFKSRRVFQLP